MSMSSFDTHEFFNELKSAGFSEQQAQVITKLQKTTIINTLEQARHDYQLDNLVTNQSLDARLRESELKNEVKLAETKADLIRWVVGVGVLQTALITVLLIKLSAVI